MKSLKKLKAEYRKIEDKQGKTDEGRKDWEFFYEMDAILDHMPVTQPHVVIDTSTEPDVEGWRSPQPTASISSSQQENSDLITPQ